MQNMYLIVIPATGVDAARNVPSVRSACTVDIVVVGSKVGGKVNSLSVVVALSNAEINTN